MDDLEELAVELETRLHELRGAAARGQAELGAQRERVSRASARLEALPVELELARKEQEVLRLRVQALQDDLYRTLRTGRFDWGTASKRR